MKKISANHENQRHQRSIHSVQRIIGMNGLVHRRDAMLRVSSTASQPDESKTAHSFINPINPMSRCTK